MHSFQLGDRVRDRISGFEGVIICRSEWLSGLVRFTVQPTKTDGGKFIDYHTFDAADLDPMATGVGAAA